MLNWTWHLPGEVGLHERHQYLGPEPAGVEPHVEIGAVVDASERQLVTN